MLEARNGVRHVLVLESADALSPDVLLQLNRIAQADEPALLQTVLLTKPSLVGSLAEPSLQFLETAIGTAIRLERLERDEVMVFIQGLLNDVVPDDRKIFSAKTVEAICDAANGDPVIVSRLARGIVDFMLASFGTGALLKFSRGEAAAAHRRLAALPPGCGHR